MLPTIPEEYDTEKSPLIMPPPSHLRKRQRERYAEWYGNLDSSARARRGRIIFWLLTISYLALLAWVVDVEDLLHMHHHHHPWKKRPGDDVDDGTDGYYTEVAGRCPQVPTSMSPQKTTKELDEMDKYIRGEEYRHISANFLSKAIQIPTVSYDNMGPIGEDKRWDVAHPDFLKWVEKDFPLMHKELEVRRVNTLNMLYIWHGTDKSLKPTLMMAHYDVVPVEEETIDDWTHPPFSGHIDEEEWIWGRGASDDKNRLVALFETVELLIKSDFRPRRTIILSFGCNEESNGPQGAALLGPAIEELYGKDGVAVIVDEGGGMINSRDVGWGGDKTFAFVATGEKGYADVGVEIRLPGGHSSIPPANTAIGVMSSFVSLVEDNPFKPQIDDYNPFVGTLHCGNQHAPGFPADIGKLLSGRKKQQLAEALSRDLMSKYLITTSSAPTVINGGVKNNALPESVSLNVNCRINIGESVSSVKAHIVTLANRVAEKYNLTVTEFGGSCKNIERCLRLSTSDELDPAPVSPISLTSSSGRPTSWAVLSGTLKAVFGDDLVMSPGIMTGNTDTRYYWNLTKNIYRMSPIDASKEGEAAERIHTVNERISTNAHMGAVWWMWTFLRVMDEVDVE